MDTRWRIELLGGLRALRGNRVHTRFETRKVAVLLAYLAFYPNRSHPRDALAEQLWPDEDPETTRVRFRQVLAGLRRVLEPPGTAPGVLIADRVEVRLDPGAVVTDVEEFGAAVRSAAEADEPADRARTLAAEAAASTALGGGSIVIHP
jgi:DNA-binding SARP family transcriptional activator